MLRVSTQCRNLRATFPAASFPNLRAGSSVSSSFSSSSSSASAIVGKCNQGSGAVSFATTAALCESRRHLQPPTNIGFGSLVPFQGFVSNDIIAGSVAGGGQHKRGILALRDLRYDVEIIRVPAYLLHVSDDPPRDQAKALTRILLKRFVEDKRHASYITKRLLALMIGGNPVFRTEDDVRDMILDVEGAPLLFQKGLLTTLDMHRMACAVHFNRTECEYRGQKGIALFPEVAFFNHSCDPNVALNYSWDAETGDYVCTGRTLRPIKAGDQLLIHYFPEAATAPLSRFQRKLQDRWSFTCLCPTCRTRTVLATLAAGVFCMVTVFVPLAVYSVYQRKQKLVNAGIA